MILWLWNEVVVWLVCFGNQSNDWLEIGNPKDEMKNEWFMIGQQEVVPNEICEIKRKKMWLGYLFLTFLLDNLTNYQNWLWCVMI